MTRVLALVVLVGVPRLAGYHLTSARTLAVRRAPLVVAEYRLNNYLLPGPLSPINNQALVKLSKAADKTESGLFLAASEQEKPREGTVVAAGPGSVHPDTGTLLPSPVAADDYVLLSEAVGEKVDYCGESHLFIDADSVLGVFEGGNTSPSTFKPTRDRVLVEIAEDASETASGIVLASQETEGTTQGQVIAAGEGMLTAQGELLSMPLAPGDSVFYPSYVGSDIQMEGKKYKVVSAADCMAKW